MNELELELLSHYSPPLYDNPAATFTTTASTVQLTSIDSLQPGALLECGLEMMYVTSFVEGTRTATVIRGHLGSTARQGATTDVIRVNPRVPQVSMLYALRDELRSWDDRLFTTQAETLTFSASEHAVAASPTRDPYRILIARPRPTGTYPEYKNVQLDLRRGDDTDVWSTGYSVHLPPGMVFAISTYVDVVYALPFNLATLDSTTDLESTVGLATTMLEILKLGILMRIVAGKQVGRMDSYGQNRANLQQDVPATTPLQAAAQYAELRDKAYDAEVRRLLSRYPYRTAA